jgi:gliding motility-associated-like protein
VNVGLAQNCTPSQLCGDSPALAEEVNNVNPVDVSCFDAQNVNFYFFTTNGTTDPGSATVTIENIDCPGSNGSDTLFATIMAFDQGLWMDSPPGQPGFLNPGTDCNTLINSFSPIDGIPVCGEDTTGIQLTVEDLETDMTYVVLVGNNQPSNQIDCGYNISIDGSAVDIDACCDGVVTLGESVELSVIGGEDPPGYNWDDPEDYLDDPSSPNPTAYPEEDEFFDVQGNIAGCQVYDAIFIQVGPPITIPNTFTPNGDAFNDTWEIGGVNRFDNVQVNVFDRGGQIVFKSVGYTTQWDGTNDGKFLPSATYYYVIELNSLDVNIEAQVGFVTILH